MREWKEKGKGEERGEGGRERRGRGGEGRKLRDECYFHLFGALTSTLCDVYKFTVNDLIDLPTSCLKELIWEEFAC